MKYLPSTPAVQVVITLPNGRRSEFPIKAAPRALDSGLAHALIMMCPKEWL